MIFLHEFKNYHRLPYLNMMELFMTASDKFKMLGLWHNRVCGIPIDNDKLCIISG